MIQKMILTRKILMYNRWLVGRFHWQSSKHQPV